MSFGPHFSHTNSTFVALGGLLQKSPMLANPGSNQIASYNPATMNVLVPVSFAAGTAYVASLPANAIITRIFAPVASVAFSAGTTFSIGNVLAGAQVISASALLTAPAAAGSLPLISALGGDGQTVFITLGGTFTAGSGWVMIEYVNAPQALQGNPPLND